MTTTRKSKSRKAEVLREYGPYPGIDHIHGVTFDGAQVWFDGKDATGAGTERFRC